MRYALAPALFLLWTWSPVAHAQASWVLVEATTGQPIEWVGGSDGRFFGSNYSDPAILRSDDEGATVEVVAERLVGAPYVLKALFENRGTLAAWFVDDTSTDGVAFFSRDQGETWFGGDNLLPDNVFVTGFGVIGDTLVLSTDAESIPGGGFGPLRVLWSADDGASWVSQAITDSPSAGAAISRRLFVDRGALYNTSGKGLYRATRGAEGWVPVTDGDLSVGGGSGLNLWDATVAEGATYVSTSGGCGGFRPGVYRRRVGEAAWARIDVATRLGLDTSPCYPNGGLAASGDVLAQLVTLPQGRETPGVAVSLDQGETWAFVGEGLPRIPDDGVAPLRLFSAGSRIYVSVFDGEKATLYRLELKSSTSSEPAPSGPAVRLWPNPVRDRLQIEAQGAATVRVTDLLGRVVSGPTEIPGHGTVSMRGLSPGVYLVTVESASAVHTRRVVRVR